VPTAPTAPIRTAWARSPVLRREGWAADEGESLCPTVPSMTMGRVTRPPSGDTRWSFGRGGTPARSPHPGVLRVLLPGRASNAYVFLGKRVALVDCGSEESQRELRVSPATAQAVVEVALQLADQPPLKEAHIPGISPAFNTFLTDPL